MAKKINNSQQAQGFVVVDARPIDDRSQFSTLEDLVDYIPPMYTTLYDGLVVTVEETGLAYRWVENEYGILDVPFQYNSWDTDLGGVDYSNKRYNFVIDTPIIWINIVKPHNLEYISFLYRDLPYKAVINKAITAEILVDNDSEITYPDSIEWDDSGFIKIKLIPALPELTNLKVKLS
jgi:hypothetical protein